MNRASAFACLRTSLRTHALRVGIPSLVVLATLGLSPTARVAAADWPVFGQNLDNTAAIGTNHGKDVSSIRAKWRFTTGGDVSARAAVVHGVVYVPAWVDYLW